MQPNKGLGSALLATATILSIAALHRPQTSGKPHERQQLPRRMIGEQDFDDVGYAWRREAALDY